MRRGGEAFCARALALPAAREEATNYRSELGLYEAAQLARAAPLRPGCVDVVEGDAHLHNLGDAVRRALLLAVRGASGDACLWLHLHAGHADVLPLCVRNNDVEPSFVYKFVDPWTDWGAALVFIASMQDIDLSALVVLTGWLDVSNASGNEDCALPGRALQPGAASAPAQGAWSEALLSADVDAVRARFRVEVAAARASVDDVAGFDEALDDYLNGSAAALPYAQPGHLRAVSCAGSRRCAERRCALDGRPGARALGARRAEAVRACAAAVGCGSVPEGGQKSRSAPRCSAARGADRTQWRGSCRSGGACRRAGGRCGGEGGRAAHRGHHQVERRQVGRLGVDVLPRAPHPRLAAAADG
jgi:hypothetical protein